MRIAQLASNVEQVPPAGYGGTELVVSVLTEQLVSRGHDVTLFAAGNSVTAARLISVTDEPLRSANIPARRWAAYDIRQLINLQAMRDEFDVVHNHMGWQALPWLKAIGLPAVTTIHNPIKQYCASIYLAYRDSAYVAISEAFRRSNFAEQLNYVATIYNGIDVSSFDSRSHIFDRLPVHQGSYLLFIGRLCKDKGTREAIEIALRLRLPIILAGKVDESDRAYFEDEVRPYLSTPTVKFIGEANYKEKIQLYKGAIATVYPINFEEPFGLVMAESLAAGTPVMALDRGSVREILSDGETAIIASNIDELISRFEEVKTIMPANCKARVRQLFSSERMTASYESVYESVIGERD